MIKDLLKFCTSNMLLIKFTKLLCTKRMHHSISNAIRAMLFAQHFNHHHVVLIIKLQVVRSTTENTCSNLETKFIFKLKVTAHFPFVTSTFHTCTHFTHVARRCSALAPLCGSSVVQCKCNLVQ